MVLRAVRSKIGVERKWRNIMVTETINMCVTNAGYKYVGHYRSGWIEIILEGGCRGVSVQPKSAFDLFDLFMCFAIDPEDGKWLHDLVGKYCRVTFDEHGKVRMIRHIVNDNLFWLDGKGGDNNAED